MKGSTVLCVCRVYPFCFLLYVSFIIHSFELISKTNLKSINYILLLLFFAVSESPALSNELLRFFVLFYQGIRASLLVSGTGKGKGLVLVHVQFLPVACCSWFQRGRQRGWALGYECIYIYNTSNLILHLIGIYS